MAVRQYVGARYVLKIYENSQDPQSTEWEAGVNYEPLIMVSYQNSSYISRKDVPSSVGNPVDNPSYWALTGLYSGQIANLQYQITEINQALGDIDELDTTSTDIVDAINEILLGYTTGDITLNDKIGNLSNLNTTNKNNLVAAANEVLANEGALSNLLTTNKRNLVAAINELFNATKNVGDVIKFIEHFSNKRIVIYGDSLSVLSGDTWTTPFVNLMTLLRSTVTVHATGGWKAADCLSAANGDSNVYDIAIVWCGINDSNEGTTLGSLQTNGTFNYNYYRLLRRLRAVNSNCEVFAFGLGYSTHRGIGLDPIKSLYFYNAAIENVAIWSGATFKNMLGLPNNNQTFNTACQSDGTHYTTTYSKTTLFYAILQHLFSSTAVPSPAIPLRIAASNFLDDTQTAADITLTNAAIELQANGYAHINLLVTVATGKTVASGDIMKTLTPIAPRATLYTHVTDSIYCAMTNSGKFTINAPLPAGRYNFEFVFIPKWIDSYTLSES